MIAFPYIYAMMLLPFNTPRWALMIIGFIYGIAVDSFSHTLGMHTSAMVFLGFIIPYVHDFITPVDGYTVNASPTVSSQGLSWFVRYVFILTFLHHFWLFFIESFQLINFLDTLIRIFFSSFFTFTFIMIFHYLTFKSHKAKRWTKSMFLSERFYLLGLFLSSVFSIYR